MRKFGRVFKLSLPESILLLATFSVLAAVRVGLFLLPFRILLQILGDISQTSRISTQVYRGTDAIRKVVWAVEVSSRYMPGGAKCLARALTTKVLLNWHGYTPDLRIGIAKSDHGQLEAHAWIEYQGRVVIGNLRDLTRFIPLPSLEGLKQ
jgi:hypothetical protein